jgi:hypothetical protein
MNIQELRERYLTATSRVVNSAQRRGDASLSLPLRAHELSVALNAGDYDAALPAFEELSDHYVAAEQPEQWLINSLSWASGRFAEHFRERSGPTIEGSITNGQSSLQK